MAFTLYGGRAWFDRAGVSTDGSSDSFVWVEDAVPAGSLTAGENESWVWGPDYVTYDYLPVMGQNKLIITQGE
ncbi:MAG TPA: hypothetical protein VGK99_06580 [Acidobacteriota bacterium]|jgi:hypothetical protein